jgi:rare lipoprotein A
MDAGRRQAAWATSALVSLVLIAAAPAPSVATPIRPGQEPRETIQVMSRTRASWYGTGFHGRATTSGRIFRENSRTAAHRTLPFGTKVEVTNVRNGRKLLVEVTDRGPFVPGRDLDVSMGVARALGFERRGVATVRMSVRVLASRGLRLVGPFAGTSFWIPPRRSLSRAPVLLVAGAPEKSPAPAASGVLVSQAEAKE